TSGASGEKVNFVAAGTCAIKASQTGNANWNAAAPVEQSFTITKGNQTITFGEPPGKSFNEGSTTLTATASSGLTVTFESMTTGVCTTSGVSGEKVSFVTAGTCTIKATQAGNANWNAAPAVEQSLTIAKGNQTITFTAPTEKRLDQSPITVTATASSGLPVTFNSKTTGVCTISGETVTFHTSGTCTIEATQTGNSNWNVAPAVERSFTVAKGNQTIAFTAPAEKRLDQGPITVEATATSGLPVTFESKTTSVCTTSGSGGETVTFHTKGTCTIKASQAGNTEWNAAPAIERSFTIAKGNQTIAFEGLPTSKRLDEGPITLKAKATSGLPVTFESKTTSVCTTSGANGETVTFHTTGTCTVKANQAGSSEWNAAAEEQSFTIAKGNQMIAFGEPPGKSFSEGSTTIAATASSGLTVTFESKTTSICTVSGANGEKVSFVAACTCTIKATQAGSSEWNAAPPVEQSFTIAKSTQTITFTAPSEKRLDQSPITVEATASSGLPVSFESKTTSTCTTSGALGEKVSFVAAGTCTIKATQAGNANWNAAPAVERSFTVAKGNQTIAFTAPTEKRLDQSPVTVEATASSSLPVTFNSKTTGVCTISGETVTLHAAGTCTIEATQTGSANWNAATPVSQSFTVAKGNQTITFNALPSKTFGEGSTTIAATASSGLAVTFESRTTSICTVSGANGEKVAFVTTGTCTIKATQAGNTSWNAATPVEQSFAITSSATTLTALSPPTIAAGEGTSRVTVSPDGKSVYATNRGGGGETVSQYSRNTETGTLTALVPAAVATQKEPEGIVVSPDGKSAYVANRASGTLSEYSRNTTTGALTPQTTIGTGEGPIGLAISPDGKQVYVANATSGNVSQFSRNTSTGELKALTKATVAAGANAHGIIVSADGKNVYVADYGEGMVSEYARNEASGELTLLESVKGGTHPHDLAISPDGASVYVADSIEPGEVLEMTRNAETGLLAKLTTIEAGKFTECIVVSPDGNSVYATNEVSGNVSQYSRDTGTGGLSALTPATIGAGLAPEGIAVSSDSKNVYVANHTSASISQYSR
ncbi:MAG TPA: beta-propeller fold lactonase family protein, partial [Solirubrobacteraceae bacterium]